MKQRRRTANYIIRSKLEPVTYESAIVDNVPVAMLLSQEATDNGHRTYTYRLVSVAALGLPVVPAV